MFSSNCSFFLFLPGVKPFVLREDLSRLSFCGFDDKSYININIKTFFVKTLINSSVNFFLLQHKHTKENQLGAEFLSIIMLIT